MEEIGEVLHLAKSGRLIVKLSSNKIKSGEVLSDDKGKRIGKIMEIFGPISSPYASVMLLVDKYQYLIGSNVYSSSQDMKAIKSPSRKNKAKRNK